MLDSLLVGALNHLLRESGWAQDRLRPHAARRLRLEAGPWSARFAVTGEGLIAPDAADAKGEPDLVLEISPAAVSRGIEGRDALLRSARMRGNVEFAEALGFVVRHLDWDVENDLSRLVGDIAAHRLARTGRELATALADSGRRLGSATADYLVHEAALAASAPALAEFVDAVDALRDRAERLEARLRRLERPA